MDIQTIRGKLAALVHDMVTLLQNHQLISHQFRSIDDRLTDLKHRLQRYDTVQWLDRCNRLNTCPSGDVSLATYLLESNICNGFQRTNDEINEIADIPIASLNDSIHQHSNVPIDIDCITVNNYMCTTMKETHFEDLLDDANNGSIFGHTLKHWTVETVADVNHYKLIESINQLAVSSRTPSVSPISRRKLYRQYGIDSFENTEDHAITDTGSVFEGMNVTQNINHSITNSKDMCIISDAITEVSANTDVGDQSGEHDRNCTEFVKIDATPDIDRKTDTATTESVDVAECFEDESFTHLATEAILTATHGLDNNKEGANGNAIDTDNKLLVKDRTVSDVNDKEHYDIDAAAGTEETCNTECAQIIGCHEDILINDNEHNISCTDNDGNETDSTNSEPMSFLDIRDGYVRCRIRSPVEDGRHDSSFYNLDSEPEFITIQDSRVVCMIKRLKRDHSSWMDDETDSENEYKIDRLYRARKSETVIDLDSDTESDVVSGCVSTKESDMCDGISEDTEGDEQNLTVTEQRTTGNTTMQFVGDETNEVIRDPGSSDKPTDEVEVDNLVRMCHEGAWSYTNSTECHPPGSVYNSMDIQRRSQDERSSLNVLSSRFTSVDSGFGDDIGESTL